MTGRPVDRDRPLGLVERFQLSGVVWRGTCLSTRAAWVRAVAEATPAELAPWAVECEPLMHAEAARGGPLVTRATIVDAS